VLRFLALLNAIVFVAIALLPALHGRAGMGFAIAMALAFLFGVAWWCAGRSIAWPLAIAWFLGLTAFLWSTDHVQAGFGMFEGGIVLIPILMYLAFGTITSVILCFSRRAREDEGI
jgi:hypothetical protein